jgi:hypothetical protein
MKKLIFVNLLAKELRIIYIAEMDVNALQRIWTPCQRSIPL